LWITGGRSCVSAQAVAVTSSRRMPHGVFIGSHAVAEGWLAAKQLKLYRRLLHNVYADPSLVDDHQLRARAAGLVMPATAAIGGRSAAAWWGAPFSSVTDPVVVVAPRGCPWDGPRGVRVHKTELAPQDVVTLDDGLRITSSRRTAWDVATLEPLLTAVALLDGMLRDGGMRDGGLTQEKFAAEVMSRRGQWRSNRAARVLPLLDGRAMSPPESKVRVVCHLNDLLHPVPQYEVYEDGVFLGQVDLAWPEAKLIVEYEGEYHFDELQIRRDDARYARLVAAGWRVIRLSSADLRDLDAVVARIRRALEEGCIAG
jgi:Protein of unknown function (DUF559)